MKGKSTVAFHARCLLLRMACFPVIHIPRYSVKEPVVVDLSTMPCLGLGNLHLPRLDGQTASRTVGEFLGQPAIAP